jgi:hypothetical protein
MIRRRREYIPLEQRLAAALACLLPQQQRDAFRRDKVPAQTVIRCFTPDHIHLHSLGGPDLWWNIDWRLRGPELNLKNAMDTSIAAKVRRLQPEFEDFRRRVLGVKKTKKPKRYRWPKRKLR